MEVKRRLNTLNLMQKFELIRAVEKGGKKKSQIAAEYGIISSTLSTILKNKEKILKAYENQIFEPNRKRLRSANYPDIENELLKWYKEERSKNMPITGHMIQARATELAKRLGYTKFVCSEGWLGRFKNRHGIALRAKSSTSINAEQFVVDVSSLVPLPREEQVSENIVIKEEIPWDCGTRSLNFSLMNSSTTHLQNEYENNETSATDGRSSSGCQSGSPLKVPETSNEDNVRDSEDIVIEWTQQELTPKEGSGERNSERSSMHLLLDQSYQLNTVMTNTIQHGTLTVSQRPKPEETFIVNKSTIFYRFLPSKYLGLKNELKYGKKWRFSVFTATNLTGTEKPPLLVVGKSKNPCCSEDLSCLPMIYATEEDMPDVFTTWLKKLDAYFLSQQRSVVLFEEYGLPKITAQLKNIKMFTMSSSATNMLKASENSMENILNAHYRRRLIQNVIHSLDSDQAFVLGVLKALLLLRTAWLKISKEAIASSYKLCLQDFDQFLHTVGLSSDTLNTAKSGTTNGLPNESEEYILPDGVAAHVISEEQIAAPNFGH